MHARPRLSSIVLASVLALACTPQPTIDRGLEVDLEYVGKLEDGSVVDASPEGGPITFVVGRGKMYPAVEKALIGMKRGETRTIEIENAYGEYDPKKTGRFPSESIGEGVKVGDYLDMVNGIPARIKEIGPEATIIDLNHPLAGKTVTFDVKVVDVRQPKP